MKGGEPKWQWTSSPRSTVAKNAAGSCKQTAWASTREAKEVCRGCVVREDCLEYALANGEKFGIWGGMSERERRRLRRARALARRDIASAS